jgi:4-hydroxybenzoyl-CoA thioesterase/acyl-CoA thioester hydrolase
MAQSFRTSRRAEFADTDAAGIVHFSVYFTWMEEAEHEFLRYLGLSLFQPHPDGRTSWPRVAASCSFQSPLTFEDTVDIEVYVERVGSKSVTYGFQFRCAGGQIAQGTMTSVCCCMGKDGAMRSIEIPPEVSEQLAVFAL